jgi:hypothetical protein
MWISRTLGVGGMKWANYSNTPIASFDCCASIMSLNQLCLHSSSFTLEDGSSQKLNTITKENEFS